MASDPDPVPGYKYRVLDALGKAIASFDELTGGDVELSTISYTQVMASGEVITRHIPGQVKYAPVTLLRAVDIESKSTLALFEKTRAGKLSDVRQNFTVEMIGNKGDAVLVRWDLINAVPTKITGFSFNEYSEAYYTTLEITLQAEEIIMTFIGSEEEVSDNIPG
jgi:phage tail-like protein